MSRFSLRVLRSAIATVLLATAGLALGQSGDATDEWLSQTLQTCAGCHGENGAAQTPNFPILAGQYRSYLIHSLKAYRDGDRENAIMAGQVQGMSDAQLQALARYYSRQDAAVFTPRLND